MDWKPTDSVPFDQEIAVSDLTGFVNRQAIKKRPPKAEGR
jgi:hypothetical protein